jgi:hypothetical protein
MCISHLQRDGCVCGRARTNIALLMSVVRGARRVSVQDYNKPLPALPNASDASLEASSFIDALAAAGDGGENDVVVVHL